MRILRPPRPSCRAAQAQVKVKQAEAEFATSTYARWRDSPKGVVSEQEREDKKAGDATARAATGGGARAGQSAIRRMSSA